MKSFQIAKIHLTRAPKPGIAGFGPTRESRLACVPPMISRKTRPLYGGIIMETASVEKI